MSRELVRLLRAAKAAAAAYDEKPEDVDVWRRVVLAVRGADLQAGEATREGQGRRSAGRAAPDFDYLATFAEFWHGLVFDQRTGQLDPDKVARELHDYSHLMNEVPEVYGHITGGRMSYVTYYARDVCQIADDHYDEIAQEHGRERAAEALREVIDEWQVPAEGDPVATRILTDIEKRIEALEGKAGVDS